MIVGQSVRIALDAKRSHAAAVGLIEYVGTTHARVSFPHDDEHSYWYKITDLDPWPPPVEPCCFVGECWALYAEPTDKWAGPCWGKTTAIDEDYADDPDLRTWVHGCEGHSERWGAYVAPPSQPSGPVHGERTSEKK